VVSFGLGVLALVVLGFLAFGGLAFLDWRQHSGPYEADLGQWRELCDTVNSAWGDKIGDSDDVGYTELLPSAPGTRFDTFVLDDDHTKIPAVLQPAFDTLRDVVTRYRSDAVSLEAARRELGPVVTAIDAQYTDSGGCVYVLNRGAV
jgi:hypothetical protein